MFNSIAKLSSYFFPSDPLIDQKKQLQKLLITHESKKTIEYLTDHPELINQPLPSGHYPVEVALSKKNIAVAYHLMANEASINIEANHRPSVVDQLIMKKDAHLNKQFFGEILGTIFANTCNALYELKPEEFANIKDIASEQLQELSEEIKKYQQIFNEDKTNELIQQILSLNVKELINYLQLNIDKFNALDVFNALLWAIFQHKNEVVEALHHVFGSKLLTLQTTDLKNLFHIAVIANNPIIILRLAQWGLSLQLPRQSDDLSLYSPYHYAILNPSLTTFLALSHAKVPYPKATNFKDKQQPLLFAKKVNFHLNPTELLILKAHINDPFPQIAHGKKLYLLLEFFLSGYDLYISSSPTTFSQIFQSLRTIVRTIFLYSDLIHPLSNKSYKNIFFTASKILALGGALSFISNQFSSYVEPIYPLYKLISCLLLIKKVWQDINRYHHSYLLRPRDTLQNALYDQLFNLLFIKNLSQDLDLLNESSKRAYRYGSNFFSTAFTSTPSCNFTEISPFSSGNMTELSERVANLSEHSLSCAIQKVLKTPFDELATSTPANCFIQSLIAPDYPLDSSKQKKFYRELARRIHPDKCNNYYSSAFCQKVKQSYFTQICAWFGK